jgi:hypothetical protein
MERVSPINSQCHHTPCRENTNPHAKEKSRQTVKLGSEYGGNTGGNSEIVKRKYLLTSYRYTGFLVALPASKRMMADRSLYLLFHCILERYS